MAPPSRGGVTLVHDALVPHRRDEQLHGDEIIHLMVHGPQAQQQGIDPSTEAHWEDFMGRAIVMLGPARFDALKELKFTGVARVVQEAAHDRSWPAREVPQFVIFKD